MASESGDIEAVMSLITAGADINHQDQVEIHMYVHIHSVLYIYETFILFLLHNVYTCVHVHCMLSYEVY